MLTPSGRDTALKRWKRAWKIDLIQKTNPEWKDLTGSWHY
jgi:putative endonuclease